MKNVLNFALTIFRFGARAASTILGCLLIVNTLSAVPVNSLSPEQALTENSSQTRQQFVLRIYEGVVFVNPNNAEQLLKMETKELKEIQNQTLTLSGSEALRQERGKYIFKVGFVVSAEPEIAKPKPADGKFWQSKVYELPEFVNRFKIGEKIIGQQKLKFTPQDSRGHIIYGRAQPVITTIELTPGRNVFTLSLDDDHLIPEPSDYKPVKTFTIILNP